MPGTFTSLHYHLVFSTKDRDRSISASWLHRLHDYLGGTITGLGGVPQGIGGMADHVHILVGLKATHCLADFVRELKKASSVWVHEEIGNQGFAWQSGYGAFSVSATARERVKHYIARQEEHHREKTFREELKEFLETAGVAFRDEHLD
jgi:putative transposase